METTVGLLQLYRLLHRELQVIEVGLLSTVPNQRFSWSHWNRGSLNAVSSNTLSIVHCLCISLSTASHSKLDDERGLRSQSSSGFTEHLQPHKVANRRVNASKDCKLTRRRKPQSFLITVLFLVDWSPTKLRVYRSISAKRLRSQLLRLRDHCHDWRKLFRFDDHRSRRCLVAVSLRLSIRLIKVLSSMLCSSSRNIQRKILQKVIKKW